MRVRSKARPFHVGASIDGWMNSLTECHLISYVRVTDDETTLLTDPPGLSVSQKRDAFSMLKDSSRLADELSSWIPITGIPHAR